MHISDGPGLQIVTMADVFWCSFVVARQFGVVNGQDFDFAVVRVDRAATPRFVPAPIRPGNAALSTGQNVAVIGTSSGIPFKIDSGGSVRDSRAGVLDFLMATTDTFGGSSGSGFSPPGEEATPAFIPIRLGLLAICVHHALSLPILKFHDSRSIP